MINPISNRDAAARALLALSLLGALSACASQAPASASPSTAPASAAATAPSSSAPAASAPALTNAELIALERTPGNSPAFPHGIEPPPEPVPGIAGTPGPSPAFGREDAPVRIDLFSDFDCGVCPRVVEPIKHLAREHPDDVRIVFRNYALARHAAAAGLAAGSLAAFRQQKFWEYHDRVFADKVGRRPTDPVAEAEALGLAVDRFRADIEDEAVIEQVKYESELAKSIGFSGTPSMVVNGRLQKGWGSYMSLKSLVDRELERAQGLRDEGVPQTRVAYEATRQAQPDGEKLARALFAIPK